MPRKRIPQSITVSRVLDRFITWASTAPEGAGDYTVGGLIKLTRVRLGMTQSQLARRCGLTQSHIANVETGKVDAQWSTLARVFKALHCRLVAAPAPEGAIDEILRAQAVKAARKRVSRVAGTMALENQGPDTETLEEMVRVEAEKLLGERSSSIWDEP